MDEEKKREIAECIMSAYFSGETNIELVAKVCDCSQEDVKLFYQELKKIYPHIRMRT